MAGLKMNVEFPTRLCEVNGELGYFHLWEQWSNPVGIISSMSGIRSATGLRVCLIPS